MRNYPWDTTKAAFDEGSRRKKALSNVLVSFVFLIVLHSTLDSNSYCLKSSIVSRGCLSL